MIDHICKGGDFESDDDFSEISNYGLYTTLSRYSKYREYDYLSTTSFRLFLTN